MFEFLKPKQQGQESKKIEVQFIDENPIDVEGENTEKEKENEIEGNEGERGLTEKMVVEELEALFSGDEAVVKEGEAINNSEKQEKRSLFGKKAAALCVAMTVFAGALAGAPMKAEARGRHSGVDFSDVVEAMAGVATIKIVDGVASGIAEGAYSGMTQAAEKVILNSAGIETPQQRYERYRYEAMQRGYGQPVYAYPQGGYVHLSGSNYPSPRRVIMQQPVYPAENYAPAQVPPGYHERGSSQRSEQQESLSGMEAEYHKKLLEAMDELDQEKKDLMESYRDGKIDKKTHDDLVKIATENYKVERESLKDAFPDLQKQSSKSEKNKNKSLEEKENLDQDNDLKDTDRGGEEDSIKKGFEKGTWDAPNRDGL